jgi:hypothetical protein
MLQETIENDLKTAMKERNEVKTSTLRMLRAALLNKAIEKKTKTLSDEDVLDTIQKQAKQRRESIEEFKKGNRADLVDKESKELTILEKYLPAKMSEEELRTIILEAIKAANAQSKADIGKVMKEVMPKLKGRADGKEINRIAAILLP